jgi:hypothetical protein
MVTSTLLFLAAAAFPVARLALALLPDMKQYAGAAVEFLDITNNGETGLVKRRKQENAMFLEKNYDSTH